MPPVSTVSDSSNFVPLDPPTPYTPDQQVTVSKLVRGVVILRSMYQQRPIMTLKVSKSLLHRRYRDVRLVVHGLLLRIAIGSLLKIQRNLNRLQSLHMLVISMNLLCEQTKHYYSANGSNAILLVTAEL
jgi:hypothetical protein